MDGKHPEGSDLRGPCPGLNTYVVELCFTSSTDKRFCSLANHGFLPRDGKNITIKMVLDAALGQDTLIA